MSRKAFLHPARQRPRPKVALACQAVTHTMKTNMERTHGTHPE